MNLLAILKASALRGRRATPPAQVGHPRKTILERTKRIKAKRYGAWRQNGKARARARAMAMARRGEAMRGEARRGEARRD